MILVPWTKIWISDPPDFRDLRTQSEMRAGAFLILLRTWQKVPHARLLFLYRGKCCNMATARNGKMLLMATLCLILQTNTIMSHRHSSAWWSRMWWGPPKTRAPYMDNKRKFGIVLQYTIWKDQYAEPHMVDIIFTICAAIIARPWIYSLVSMHGKIFLLLL